MQDFPETGPRSAPTTGQAPEPTPKASLPRLLALASFLIGLLMIPAWGWLGSPRSSVNAPLYTALAAMALGANGLGAVLGIVATLKDETTRTLGLIGAACNASEAIFILLYSAAFQMAG